MMKRKNGGRGYDSYFKTRKTNYNITVLLEKCLQKNNAYGEGMGPDEEDDG